MIPVALLAILFLSTLSTASIFGRQPGTTPSSSSQKPTKLTQCKDLHASSGGGDRKIGIVIDASDSMIDNDPYDYRLAAGRAINSWLLPKSKASEDIKPDLVTVVEFANTAKVLYPLGDPSGAGAAFNEIDINGSTYAAGGIQSAESQIFEGTAINTYGNSGIVVLTNGDDTSTAELIDAIHNATEKGIRVSFGFLSLNSSLQDSGVLTAILSSGGSYSTITNSRAQQGFVNEVLVNGLTNGDGTQGLSNLLQNGLSIGFISKSKSNNYVYHSQESEVLQFTINNVNASALDVTITDSTGVTLGKATVGNDSSSSSLSAGYIGTGTINVTSMNGGDLNVAIQDNSNKPNAIFTVGVTSNLPIQNCTLGAVPSSGMPMGEKIGLWVGIPVFITALGVGLCCFSKRRDVKRHPSSDTTRAENGARSHYFSDKFPDVEVSSVSSAQTPDTSDRVYTELPAKMRHSGILANVDYRELAGQYLRAEQVEHRGSFIDSGTSSPVRPSQNEEFPPYLPSDNGMYQSYASSGSDVNLGDTNVRVQIQPRTSSQGRTLYQGSPPISTPLGPAPILSKLKNNNGSENGSTEKFPQFRDSGIYKSTIPVIDSTGRSRPNSMTPSARRSGIPSNNTDSRRFSHNGTLTGPHSRNVDRYSANPTVYDNIYRTDVHTPARGRALYAHQPIDPMEDLRVSRRASFPAQNGRYSPANGGFTPDPINGRFTPDPVNGRFSPATGRFSPANGKLSPANGKFSPANGKFSPANGQSTPVNGRSSPVNTRLPPATQRSRRRSTSSSRRVSAFVFPPPGTEVKQTYSGPLYAYGQGLPDVIPQISSPTPVDDGPELRTVDESVHETLQPSQQAETKTRGVDSRAGSPLREKIER